MAIRWLSVQSILYMHHELIAEHGGGRGLRDAGLLESALARPRNLYDYEQADLPHLAAAYAFGIARNHPFVDGNKRTALMALYTFLKLNGLQLFATEEDTVLIMLRLAKGKLREDELAKWIEGNLE